MEMENKNITKVIRPAYINNLTQTAITKYLCWLFKEKENSLNLKWNWKT